MKTAGLVWIGRCVVIPRLNPVIAVTDLVLDSNQIIIFPFFVIMLIYGIIVIVVRNTILASPVLVSNPFDGNIGKEVIIYDIFFLGDDFVVVCL